MKTHVTRSLGLLVIATALTAAGNAMAQEGKTRAEVRAELEEAIKSGDIITGDQGLKRNEIAPSMYPAKTQLPGKSRGQVRAELEEAVRAGDIATGEQGLKRNEIAPGLYPAQATAPGKTRDEVKRELAEAVRTGDIITGEQGLKRNEVARGLYSLPTASSARRMVHPETETPAMAGGYTAPTGE